MSPEPVKPSPEAIMQVRWGLEYIKARYGPVEQQPDPPGDAT